MTIQNVARRKLRIIEAAKVVEDLRITPGNRLEKLVRNLDGFYSKRKTPADGSHQLGFPRCYTGLVGRDNN